jgi:hypothetical protein
LWHRRRMESEEGKNREREYDGEFNNTIIIKIF